ncbi:MAG: class I SAM-dependent methyltransferase [Spirochaetales bacterium]|nr:class I SAM-dependent methyltransferase [Spirochaetales bacterium]
MEDKFLERKNVDLSRLNLIRQCDKERLNDLDFLEKDLLPALGLNDEFIEAFPTELHAHCGKGVFHWQYPNQFSKYLCFLSQFNIRSYLEIGIRWGGTFLIILEYLKRFGNIKRAVAIDFIDSPIIEKYKQQEPIVEFYRYDTQNEIFRDFINKQPSFDLVFIDGDHSQAGCFYDFNSLYDNAKIITFHDIVDDHWKGVGRVWKHIKEEFSHIYDFHEFIDQYESIQKQSGLSCLGIGVAVRKGTF